LGKIPENVKNYIDESALKRTQAQPVVDEYVDASTTTISANTTTPQKVAEGRVPDGYNGVIVSVAVTRNTNVSLWLKIAGKQVYPNGLNTYAFRANMDEVFLGEDIYEGESWELGFTNTSDADVDVSWLIRVRYFKKGV